MVVNNEDQIDILRQELKSSKLMIGFRATAVGNASSGISNGNKNPGKTLVSVFVPLFVTLCVTNIFMAVKTFITICNSVSWRSTEYNSKNALFTYFDGTHFTAPARGIYSFHVTVRQASSAPGHIYLYSNGEIAAHSQRADYNGYAGSIVIQARLLLEKGFKVRTFLCIGN